MTRPAGVPLDPVPSGTPAKIPASPNRPGATTQDDDLGKRQAARSLATVDTGARNGWPETKRYRRGAARAAWALRAIAQAEAEHGAPACARRKPPAPKPPPAARAAIDPQRVAEAIRAASEETGE